MDQSQYDKFLEESKHWKMNSILTEWSYFYLKTTAEIFLSVHLKNYTNFYTIYNIKIFKKIR